MTSRVNLIVKSIHLVPRKFLYVQVAVLYGVKVLQ